jgi:2-polyprenyl-3-methyl-5-hydroxy-6-metoxy-1,4-benzoquinol methylase
MADLISKEYRKLIRDKHVANPWGGQGHSWVFMIAPLLNTYPPGITILDFGCGRGTFKKEMLKFRPDAIITEYDPGVPGKDVLDWTQVDFITCTDVMEHVEEKFVDNTLISLNALCKGGIFFNIDLQLARSLLPDGSNAHITIKPPAWWQAKLDQHFHEMEWTLHRVTKGQYVVSGKRTWGVP